MTSFDKLFSLLHKEEKRAGSDYTATVTRIKDGTAYVQITGAEINDTPVAMSVDAKPGDAVRMRVNNGKAWLTGNDTRPPNDSTEQMQKVAKANAGFERKLNDLTAQAEKLMPAFGKDIAEKFSFESGVTVLNNHVVQHGQRVFFNIEIYLASVSTTDRITIGSVDAAIIPNSDHFFTGVVTDSGYFPKGNAILIINNQGVNRGKMRIASSTSAGGYIFFDGSYEI